MAKMNLKRSIAMLLVLNMLTGMLPIQALAEDGNTEAPEITVTVSVSSESAPKSESKSEAAPAAEEKSETKSEAAPAAEEKSETKSEAAPAAETKSEADPAAEEKSEPVVTETASVETASYDGGDAEKIEHDTNLTLGENVDVTVSKETVTSTDEEGNTVEIETTEVTTSGTADNGDKVEGEETFVETTTTTENEIIVESVLEGEQETTTEEAPIAPGEEVPEVVAPIIPDAEDAEEGTVTETVEGEDGTVTETTTTIEKVTDEETGDESVKVTVNVTETSKETVGDEPESEDDTDFDFSEIETTIVRDVTTEVESSEITEEVETNFDNIVGPEDYDGKHYDSNTANKNNPQFDGVNAPAIFVQPEQAQPVPEDGYDFFLSGMGEYTDAAAPVFKHIVYQRDADGNPLVDENGNYLIDEEKSKLIDGSNGKAKETGMDYQAGQLVLTYKDGEYFYAYCADYLVETSQVPGYRYKLENLEDSGHYSKEDAGKLRAIVEKSYWGNEEGKGSVSNIKEMLNDYAEKNPTVTVKDKNGNDVEYNLADLIEGLKEHEALAVSQAAIWAYSINRKDSLDGVDKVTVVGAQSAIKCFNSKGGQLSEYTPANDQSVVPGLSDEERAAREAAALESDARMKAMFDCLMALEPIDDSAEGVTTVINEDNFVEDMNLIVKDKAEDHEANNDDNDDNDVYNTELNFTLAFVPDQKNDDLLVYILDENGNKINGSDGKPIVKRLAGENKEGEDHDTITADENGVYTLTGLQLSEGSVKFDLTLEGTQLLQDGVYLYTAHGGRLASQTLVGMAGGTQDVNVKASMSLKFEVDESKTVVATRKWRETTEETNPRENEETPPPPAEYRMGFGVGQLEVIEEEVPLAAPPQTGDMSILWFAMIALSGCGLCILNLLEKRKCRA